MVSLEDFRKSALAFPEAVEMPHFEKPSFRVRKKIFATLHEKTGRAVLKLSAIDQSVFCAYENQTVFYPIPGGWGRQGWTFVELAKVPEEMLQDALKQSYVEVAPPKLGALVRDKEV